MLTGLREYVETIAATFRPDKSPLTDLMKNQARYLSRPMVLDIAARLSADVPGCIVEFGVAAGGSTRHLRSVSQKQIYALDSFEGLREKFERVGVGHFAGPVPDIPGVNFVKGYFEDTCTEELAARVGRVAFAHLDADLYSSTLFALRWLTPLLGHGSVLLFDEFVGENRSEARAFADWQAETGTIVARIAEFDREPSGGGDIPDKRLLCQVLVEMPKPGEQVVWTANARTFLKASTAFAASLAATEKVEVQPGDVMTSARHELHGAHVKLSGVELNRRPLARDWFILRTHWDIK